MSRNISDSDALKRLAFANPAWRITLGDAQSTGEYFTGVAAGNTKQIVLKNPTTDEYYGVYGVKVRTSARAKINKAFNVTEDTQGNAPTTGITNKRSSGNGSTASVHVGGNNETGAYSGGDAFSPKGTGSGTGSGGGASPGATSEGGYDNVVTPGDNLLVSVQNTSGASMNYISIDIDWSEIPEDTFPA